MNPITTRLSVMMFLQFFIWGGWFVTLGTFLGAAFSASGGEIGQAFSTQSWGAIIAPFIIGLIADRFFNAERILGVLHLIGALLMYLMYSSSSFASFYPYVLGYMIIYMPTLALVNSVSFRQLTDPAAQFGKIRVWGTIGWIAAGLFISTIGWDAQQAVAADALRNTFLLCSIVSLILGVYSFTLPATPPVRVASQSVVSQALGLDALRLLKDRNFAVFFLSSVLICIPLAFYYQNTNLFLAEIGVTNPTGKMTVGQMSEVLFMLLLPVFLNRYGIKKTLLIGMAAWVLRYVLFAFGAQDSVLVLLIGGIALHGVCYDFFFVSGQIYTDSKAGEQYKSSAQGLITLATYGVGMLAGFKVAGMIYDQYALTGGHDWKAIWLIPAALAAGVFALFALAFKPESIQRGGAHDELMGNTPAHKRPLVEP
ncbi:MAG TPA: nucleoside permease [Steroidobacter sp.]|nr:nucleoside permease [Steroidobacter sp.]